MLMMPRRHTTPARVRGASLIEVLVSIVIASVGLLALAGANSSAVRYTKMSQYRGTAAFLASDIGERMRANLTGFKASNYTFTTDFTNQATAPTLPSEMCNASTSNCTAAQIAAADLGQWRVTVRNLLPEGSVFIQTLSTQNGANVWVVWRDPAVADDDERATTSAECPNGLNLDSDLSVRCSYFRVNM